MQQKMPSMSAGRKRAVSSSLKRNDPGKGAGMMALVLVTVSVILFTMGVREDGVGPLSTVRDVTQTIVSPLRMLGAGIVSPFTGLGNIMRNLTADEETLSELREENERLTARNVELEEAEQTAQRLQALLDLRSTYNLQSVAASVIAGSTDSWSNTVTIDKGAMSGITVGMPVVDSNGAVGQVIACASTTSTVRLIADAESSVSAMVQQSRAQGMLEGSIDGTLRLAYIRTDQTINVGDIVVTSGLGGVFPKGLPLGRVSVVESTPGSSYYEIVVEPYTSLSLLEEVVVVTSLTEGQEASADDIAIADAADLEAAGGTAASLDGDGATSEDGYEGSDEEGASQTPDGTQGMPATTQRTVATIGVSGTENVHDEANEAVVEDGTGGVDDAG